MVNKTSSGDSASELPIDKNRENILPGEELFNALSKKNQDSDKPFSICPPVELLTAFALGDPLDPAASDLIKEHLDFDQCDICREYVYDNQRDHKDTENVSYNPSYSSEMLWELRIEYMKANHPERLYIPEENEALLFDIENIPPLYGVVAEPFLEFQHRYYGTDETSSKVISGIVVWHKKGREICRACVNVRIVFEDFQEEKLSISGHLVKDTRNLVPPFAKWYCTWKTDSAEIPPDDFVYDKDSGHFTAIFSMHEKNAGRFMLLFIAQIGIN